MPAVESEPSETSNRLGPWLAPVILTSLIAAQLAATRAFGLFDRRPWLDEFHTMLVVDDPSFSHAMMALKQGADTNAPGLYLIARAVSWCLGTSGAPVLRGISFASVVLGLAGIYAAVRRVFSPSVASVAVMAAWAHPMLVRHAFEGRFYGPWFAAIIWFAWSLNKADRSPRKAWPNVMVAVMAVLVCTMHYLGVISLAMVAGSHLVCSQKSWRSRLLGALPILAGPVALAACLPFYFGQKGSIPATTWIDPPRLSTIRLFFDETWTYYLFAIPVAAFFASTFLGRARPDREPEERGPITELAGLASLVAMPVVLVAMSILVQPMMVDRYAISVVASFGVLLAPMVARTGRALQCVVVAGLLLCSTVNLVAVARWGRISDAARVEVSREIEALPDGPILYRSRANLYEFWWDAPSSRDRFFLWDPKDLGAGVHPQFFFEQAMAKNHERLYGMAPAAGLEAFRDRPVVYLYGLVPKDVLDLSRLDPTLRLRSIDDKRGLFEVTRCPTVANQEE